MRFLVPYVFILAFLYVFTKDGLDYASPYSFMTLSSLIAAAALFLYSKKFRPILNADTALISVFSFLSWGTWIVGLKTVSPAQSAILSFTMPLFSLPLSVVILKERASSLELLGSLVGFGGIVLYGLSLTGSSGTEEGALLTVINAVFWALYTVYFRKAKNQDPVQTTATMFLLSGAGFAVLSVFGWSLALTARFALDLVFVSLIGSALGVYLWMYLTGVEKISRLTTLTFAAPVITLVYQTVALGEAPSLLSLAGVALIFSGIYLSSVIAERKETKMRVG
jgi:drug/metabolite transporter (DMT)-like permease